MRADPFDLQPGDKIDRYELLLPVASGGTSQIWAARLCGTRGFEKLVALKTLTVPDSGGRELERMLWQEARLAARLQHPNVAQCFDLIEHERALCLTLEWIDGESLSAVLRESWRAGGVPLGIALQIAVQACKGLHAAHELCDAQGQPLGLVHCDVSPQNLMIDAAGTVKWVDFGIAKVQRGKPRADTPLMGKPSFMAPEQATGQTLDRRADLFSLGIVLYLLTTGRHPFRGESSADTLRAICANAAVTPPSKLVPKYPASLERILLRALAHEPAERFQSAAEMLEAITRAIPGYASEAELAAFLARVLGHSLDERRARVQAALQYSPRSNSEHEPSSLALASLGESTPDTLSPASLAVATAPAAQRRELRPLWLALGATGLAFVAAFAWTAGSSRSPAAPAAARPIASALPAIVASAAAASPPATSASVSGESAPSASSNAAPPTPSAKKSRKPLSMGARYGI